jgi:hypothetical protein
MIADDGSGVSDLEQIGAYLAIKSQGIEETLRVIAAQAETPVAIDSVTTLAQIEADGAQLRRSYVVDSTSKFMSNEFRIKVTNGICAYGPFISLLREGATIREIYLEPHGALIGAVMVSRDICGF